VSKLYSYTYMSLDGVIESPEKWTPPYFSEELGQDLSIRLESADAMVLGRATYTEFSRFWPTQADDVPFATLNNTIRKYVVSRTIQHPEWQNTTVISDVDVRDLKSGNGGDLHIAGSGTLVRNWLQQGVVDEVRIMLCPIVLGHGKRLFENGSQTALTLAEVRQFPLGVVSLNYLAQP